MKEGQQSWRASKRVTHAKFHLGKMGKKIGRTCLKHKQRISDHLQKRWMMCHWTLSFVQGPGSNRHTTGITTGCQEAKYQRHNWIKLGDVSRFFVPRKGTNFFINHGHCTRSSGNSWKLYAPEAWASDTEVWTLVRLWVRKVPSVSTPRWLVSPLGPYKAWKWKS